MKVNINGYIVANEEKEIYDWYGIDAFSPRDIADAIGEANGERLEIEIGTCYGGSIFAGSEIAAAIQRHTGGAEITITGLAASAASVIAMAAYSRMYPTAMMMVHNVSSIAAGDYHEMDKTSESLRNANKAIAAAYVVKSGMSEKDALKMMDAETWLTAAQAKEKGLIDEVMFEASQMVAAIGPGMLPKAVIEKTRKMLTDMKVIKESAEPIKEQDKMVAIARAKLNLFEKTM